MKTRLIGLLLLTAISTAACGSAEASSDDGVATIEQTQDSGEEAETVELDTEAQLLAFAECIRQQGFDIEDPTVDADGNVQLPRGERTEGMLEARQACEQFLEGVTLGFRGGDQTEIQDQLLEFASCMRENGFDMPDPDFSAPGGGRVLGGIDQDDPTYQAAFASCEDLLANFGGGRGN